MGKTMPMPGTEQPYRWDLEDMMEEEESKRSLNATLPRSLPKYIDPEPRGIPNHNVTPLLKRATVQDLEAARNIVKKALAESSKLNKARVAQPVGNKYGLRPGTIVGGGKALGDSSSASVNQSIPPLLDITKDIAAAAALVAEAEMMGGLRNLTKKRAAAATAGTYWMQR